MASDLKFGLFSMNTGPCSYPDAAGAVARAAEAGGFESLWVGEHVVLPDPQAPPSPMAPEDRILDPVVALTFLAAQTSTVRLGTGIIIMPQRNPLVLAKELASLDVLSNGRLIFGSASATWNRSSARWRRRSRIGGRERSNISRRCTRSGRRRSPPMPAASFPSMACRRGRVPCRLQREGTCRS